MLARNGNEPRDYVTNGLNPCTWMMACLWCHFLLASYRTKLRPRITYAKLREIEKYRVNSKSGVNFQVELKRDRAIRNCIKRDLLVLFSHKPHSVERSVSYIALTGDSSSIPDGWVNRKVTKPTLLRDIIRIFVVWCLAENLVNPWIFVIIRFVIPVVFNKLIRVELIF